MMFYFIVLLLCAVAAAFVLVPIWSRRILYEEERKALNVALFRERLADLGQNNEEAEALELEAKIDLLTDSVEEEQVDERGDRKEVWLIAAAFLVPISAVFIYMDFGLGQGAISDVRLMERLRNVDMRDEAAHTAMLDELAERAERRPEDGELNFFLARSYQAIGLYDESMVIFRRLLDTFPNDAGLQSAFAQALFVSSNRKMTADVILAVDKALAMNPHDVSMLEVKGVAAISEGRPADAADWFRKALATGVSGERADMLRRAISNINTEVTSEVSARSLTVQVSAADNLVVPQSSAVFVYARAASGPPAPLAVQRLSVTTLPREVILDETMAMIEGMGLANFDQVIVIARISRSGDVMPKVGDYEARSEIIDMNEIPDEIRLIIADPVSL